LRPKNVQKGPICGDQRVKPGFLARFSHFCDKKPYRHSPRRFLVLPQFVLIPGGQGAHTRTADVWAPPLFFNVTNRYIHPSLLPANTKKNFLTPHFLTFSGHFQTFFRQNFFSRSASGKTQPEDLRGGASLVRDAFFAPKSAKVHRFWCPAPSR